MRIQKHDSTVKLWLSAKDTYNWAHKAGALWPCSVLADKRLFAEFSDGDLIDYTVNGKLVNVPADEFNAMTGDFLAQHTSHKQRKQRCNAVKQ